jgi:hypothetical protein
MSHVESTWATRDPPILVAAYRRVEAREPQSVGQLEEMRQELGLSVGELEAGLEALESADPPYIETVIAGGWTKDKAGGGFITGVSERTRRELGAWPSADTFVEQLAAALSRAADEEPEPERKSRLREAAEVLGGMAREIAVNVISAKIGQP